MVLYIENLMGVFTSSNLLAGQSFGNSIAPYSIWYRCAGQPILNLLPCTAVQIQNPGNGY
jgi:hypothetical protein